LDSCRLAFAGTVMGRILEAGHLLYGWYSHLPCSISGSDSLREATDAPASADNLVSSLSVDYGAHGLSEGSVWKSDR
jgi:hypothetical protein